MVHASTKIVEPSLTGEAEPAAIVVSDRVFVRDLLLAFLHEHGFPQARPGATLNDALAVLSDSEPAMVIVDLGMEKADPQVLLAKLRHVRPRAAVIAIGGPMQLAALAPAADGWIELSDPAERLELLARTVNRSGCTPLETTSLRLRRHLRVWSTLTTRQRQILGLLACGVTNHKLARALAITERTVKSHVAVLLDKFKADNRTELALIASRAGLRSPLGNPPFLP